MVEKEKFLVTHKELVEKFGAATTDTTKIVGKWIYQNQLYEDKLIRIVIDTEPSDNIDEYFKQYKELLKERFKQIDIWITRHEIDVI
jgi:uracil-DNA glycosylase